MNNPLVKSTAWCFTVTYLAYTAIYIARLNLSIVAPSLTSGSIMSKAEIGLLGGVFAVVYACGRLFNGALNDRVAPWVMLSSGLAAVGASNIISGLFPPFFAMAILWGINAYGQSMLWGSVLHVVSSLYDADKARRRSALAATSVAAGNIIAIAFNTWLIEHFGMQYAFFVPGALNVIMCPLVYLSLRHIHLESIPKGRSLFSFIKLLRFKRMRIMLLPALFHGIVKDSTAFWMALYFVDVFKIDLKSSWYFMLLIPVIGLAGRLTYNFFYRLSKSDENIVASVSFLLSAIAAVLLLLPIGIPLVSGICLGFIYAALSIANTSFLAVFPLRFAKIGEAASASGLMDFTTYFSWGLGSIIYGVIIKNFQTSGYYIMFASWVILSLASAFLMRIKIEESN